MTEKTIYICDYCGKAFDDDRDCYLHEWEHKFELFKNRIKFMKVKNGVLTELPLALESVDECTVIYCDGTDEAWDTLDEAFDWEGYYCVSKDIRADGHIFVYDRDADKWFCLEEKSDYFAKFNAEVNKIIEGK